MRITRRPLDLKSQLYSREYNVERSAGCHLMQIVNYLDKAGGHSSKYRKELTDRTMETLAASGFIWEHVAARTEQIEDALSLEAMRVEFMHRPELIFPGEHFWCSQCELVIDDREIAADHIKTFKHTGIFFTPDGLNTERIRVAEFKFTWVSSSRTGEDHLDGIWKWPIQNMAYCYGTGYLAGEMKVVFVVGDYKQGSFEPFPEAYEFDIDYSQRELDENWSMLVSNARAMEWI